MGLFVPTVIAQEVCGFALPRMQEGRIAAGGAHSLALTTKGSVVRYIVPVPGAAYIQ